MSDNKNAAKTGKNPVASYSILFALLLAVFAVLAVFTVLGRSSWSDGLKEQVVNELGESFEVGEFVELNSSISTSMAVYNVIEKSSKKNMKAVLVKVTSVYGPIPGLFLWDGDSRNAEFVKYLTVGGIANRQITDNTNNSQIQYWKNHIPSVIIKCIGGEE